MSICAALFVRSDSIYKTMPGVDCYDIDRDATSYAGKLPVVAHPPCRAWGMLRAFAKPRPGEKELARWAIRKIREVGGVLEHPRGSSLWKDMQLPLPGWLPDEFGGWTLEVEQCRWGHKAEKKTLLYICGTLETPPIPDWREPTHCLHCSPEARQRSSKKELPKSDREKTPPEFAQWLVDVAVMAGKGGS